MSRNLESALAYAQRFNFAVLPVHSMNASGCSCNNPKCKSPAKHPRNAQGVNGATKDYQQIYEWWTRWPDANIGIACGEISQITVLDIDIKQHCDGRETLAQLEKQYGPIPTTPVQISGGQGCHYFFKNESSVKTGVELLPGIDIRNNGSFIITAPSIHASGNEYSWAISNHVGNTKFNKMPEWLTIALNGHKYHSPSYKNNRGKWDNIISGIYEGGRNNAATSLAGHLFYKKVDLSIILWIMENWNKQNIPPLEADELEQVILSVAKKQGVHV